MKKVAKSGWAAILATFLTSAMWCLGNAAQPGSISRGVGDIIGVLKRVQTFGCRWKSSSMPIQWYSRIHLAPSLSSVSMRRGRIGNICANRGKNEHA